MECSVCELPTSKQDLQRLPKLWGYNFRYVWRRRLGLPEFHSLGIGKHAVILNAHSYKEWANDKNSVLVEPSGKEDVYDNIFFHKGQDWNQGQIFSWEEDEFIHACETAITRVEESRVNKEGLNIPKDFSLDKTIDVIKNNLAS